MPSLALLLGGCAAIIEAPIRDKTASFEKLALSTGDREALEAWLGANSTFAFSHAAGVRVLQEPGETEQYVVQIVGTGRSVAGGLAAAVSLDGYYVTAAHVLSDDGPVLLVRGGKEGIVQERARVVWRAPGTEDLALIKGPPRHSFFPLADTVPGVGEMVAAGGATGGDSVGVVLRVEGRKLLHSAPLRRGDSGGPLVNARGELVGVNRAIHYDMFHGRRNEATIAAAAEILPVIQSDRRSGTGD